MRAVYASFHTYIVYVHSVRRQLEMYLTQAKIIQSPIEAVQKLKFGQISNSNWPCRPEMSAQCCLPLLSHPQGRPDGELDSHPDQLRTSYSRPMQQAAETCRPSALVHGMAFLTPAVQAGRRPDQRAAGQRAMKASTGHSFKTITVGVSCNALQAGGRERTCPDLQLPPAAART